MSEVRVTQQLKAGALVAVLSLGSAAAAAGQTPAESREASLSRGWSRLAASPG